MSGSTCVRCGHHWSDHIPPAIHKRGVSCTHTTFGSGRSFPCECPEFVFEDTGGAE